MAVGFDPGENPLPVDGFPIRRGGSVFYNKDPDPSGKEPRIPRRMKGKWDESSVEQELPIIMETKKILDVAENATKGNVTEPVKKNLKQELETLGWVYNRGATFKANFPFRSKHLIFDSAFTKKGASDIHRLKVVKGNNGVSGYKLMKWVPK